MWSHGVDANAEDWLGAHALVSASRRGDQSIVALLLGLGADPNIADKSGDYHTPLTAAVSEGHEEIVRHLITAGADVNRQRLNYLETPLEIARRTGGSSIEQILIAAGAHDRLA
jgi:ankyrin repeat protein